MLNFLYYFIYLFIQFIYFYFYLFFFFHIARSETNLQVTSYVDALSNRVFFQQFLSSLYIYIFTYMYKIVSKTGNLFYLFFNFILSLSFFFLFFHISGFVLCFTSRLYSRSNLLLHTEKQACL